MLKIKNGAAFAAVCMLSVILVGCEYSKEEESTSVVASADYEVLEVREMCAGDRYGDDRYVSIVLENIETGERVLVMDDAVYLNGDLHNNEPRNYDIDENYKRLVSFVKGDVVRYEDGEFTLTTSVTERDDMSE